MNGFISLFLVTSSSEVPRSGGLEGLRFTRRSRSHVFRLKRCLVLVIRRRSLQALEP